MWMLIGLIFILAGKFINKTEKLFGLIFILCGAGAFIGSFLLKKVSVVFDKNTNSAIRCWRAWTGIMKNIKTVKLDQITAIVYEHEHRRAPRNEMKQRFSLYANTKENENFYFYPVTYTSLKAKKFGVAIAKFLGISFQCLETDRGNNLFKSQSEK